MFLNLCFVCLDPVQGLSVAMIHELPFQQEHLLGQMNTKEALQSKESLSFLILV
jgi:hypothetical protein